MKVYRLLEAGDDITVESSTLEPIDQDTEHDELAAVSVTMISGRETSPEHLLNITESAGRASSDDDDDIEGDEEEAELDDDEDKMSLEGLHHRRGGQSPV